MLVTSKQTLKFLFLPLNTYLLLCTLYTSDGQAKRSIAEQHFDPLTYLFDPPAMSSSIPVTFSTIDAQYPKQM